MADISKSQREQMQELPSLPGEDATFDDFREFFTPEVISERLVVTPRAFDPVQNQERADYQPGFIVVGAETGNTERTMNTDDWEEGVTQHSVNLGEHTVTAISRYEVFPRSAFEHDIITFSTRPKAFVSLLEILQTDLATLQAIEVPDPHPFKLSNYF